VRVEIRRAAVAIVALALGVACARPYAQLAAPIYATAVRLLASGHPWDIVSLEVAPAKDDPGSVLELVGTVRQQASDDAPAARLVARVHVGEAIETPIVFWTLLLMWPAASVRARVLRCCVALPVFVGLECLTTVAQLMYPFPTVSALLAGERDPVPLLERWSRFLEAGGRFVIEVCAAMLAVTIANRLGPGARPATGLP
jgi:hypothetical protein